MPSAASKHKEEARLVRLVKRPLGTVENATMGRALTRTAAFTIGERGARCADKRCEFEQAFGHLTKVDRQMRQR